MTDTKLHQLELKTDVRETLEDALKWCDGLEVVMLVAISKDGSQILRTSTMSGQQKAFLVAFMNAWLSNWFSLEMS